MFVDARKIHKGTQLRSRVCVVGAGVAGIALALEFEKQGIDTIVLESGGLKADDATRDLYRGENIGLPYVFADNCRSRFLGGSSNCWGGWCAPMKPQDFAHREWVTESGWPITYEEMVPYYERVHDYLKLGPYNYDTSYWASTINRSDVKRIPLVTGKVEDHIAQFSTPSQMGRVHYGALKEASHVRVYLHANLTDIALASPSNRIKKLEVQTLTGSHFTVEADYVILACGGIENARILLACNKQSEHGLGNEKDLVGRYFADHPRITLGRVKISPAWQHNKLYDIKFHYRNTAVSAGGTFVSAQFSLSKETQAKEGLLNAQIWFSSVFAGESTSASDAIIRTKQRMHGKRDPLHSFIGDLGRMAIDPISTASFVAARLLHPRQLIKGLRTQVICEPSPNRDSRVTLSNERDALGMPRVRVDWKLSEQTKHTFDRTLAIFSDELRLSGVANLELPTPLSGREWPHIPATPWDHMGTWHHMGTTRMSDDPKQGVVNQHCRVHSIENLYIAGSSVFPTYGANYPTMTIAALSFRLADHLIHRIAQDNHDQ